MICCIKRIDQLEAPCNWTDIYGVSVLFSLRRSRIAAFLSNTDFWRPTGPSSTPTVSARALPLPSHPTLQAATDLAPLPLWCPQLPAADLLRHAAGGKEPTGASRPCSSHLIYPDTSLNVPELPCCHSGWRVLASVPMSMGSG